MIRLTELRLPLNHPEDALRAAVLAQALQRGHEMVPLLLDAARATSTIVTLGHDT